MLWPEWKDVVYLYENVNFLSFFSVSLVSNRHIWPEWFNMCMLWSASQLNPSNAKATFIQSTRTQRFIETHLNPVMLVLIV